MTIACALSEETLQGIELTCSKQAKLNYSLMGRRVRHYNGGSFSANKWN